MRTGEAIGSMLEITAFALAKCPGFAPDDGLSREKVFAELRARLGDLRNSWWGNEALYGKIEDLIATAAKALDENNEDSALGAFSEIYKMVDQTPTVNSANDA